MLTPWLNKIGAEARIGQPGGCMMILVMAALIGWGLFLLASSLLGAALWGEEQATDRQDRTPEDSVAMMRDEEEFPIDEEKRSRWSRTADSRKPGNRPIR